MIQLINSLPFPVDTDSLVSLRKDWTRFQDGLVILAEIPDAIRGEFECEAEVLKQQDEDDESDSEDSDKSDVSEDALDNESSSFDEMIPSGPGKLVLTAR